MGGTIGYYSMNNLNIGQININTSSKLNFIAEYDKQEKKNTNTL